MESALREARGRMVYLERGYEKLDPLTREKVVILYADFISYSENLSGVQSIILANHSLMFEKYKEFRREVENLVGLSKMEELFGSDVAMDSLYEHTKKRIESDYESS